MRGNVLLSLPSFAVEGLKSELHRDDLEMMVRNGTAVSFDKSVCPMRPVHAWQWTILDAKMSFRKVPSSDFVAPGLLSRRGSLALHFPVELHDIVTATGAHKRQYCWGVPKGLRAILDYAEAWGEVLQLPHHYVWREAKNEVAAVHPSLPWLPEGMDLDLMYVRFLQKLWSTSAVEVEVLENRNPEEWLWPLKSSGDRQLHLLLPASSILGSAWMDRLVRASPWPFYAVAMGAAPFWRAMLSEMPAVLKHFETQDMLMVLDAYDMVFANCKPDSILFEYRKHEKPLLVSAEKFCFPKDIGSCPSCADSYCRNSDFHYLNSGGIMGTADALSHAFLWMQENTPDTGDDQAAWHLYHRKFPERVALEHQPRIWVTLQGAVMEQFVVRSGERCGVVEYQNSEACFLHGNGAAKNKELPELYSQMEASCGRAWSPAKVIGGSHGFAGMSFYKGISCKINSSKALRLSV